MGVLQRSERLQGVHPKLVVVAERAAGKLPFDLLITDGVRSKERQHELYGQGRTAAELRAKGVDPKYAKPAMNKVTWTLNSNHFVNPKTGKGHALDCYRHPFNANQPLSVSRQIARAFLEAAHELNTAIRWGSDWNRNGIFYEKGETDSPHFELWGIPA